MNTFSRFSILAVLVLCLLLSIQDAFAAKRLGGGGNIGRQRDTQTFQRAPTPSPVAPPGAARPNAPGVPGNAAAPAPVRPAAPAPAPAPVPQRNSWMGPLAGFAGGALLGGLLFGGHGGGFGGGDFGGGILNIVMMGLIVGGFIFLVRRFLFSAPPQQYAETAPMGWVDAAPQPQSAPQGSFAPGAQQAAFEQAPFEQAPLNLPPGFDLPGFIRESKLAYVRLQAANDAGDLNDIRQFTTPQMYAEIALAIQERGGVQQRVEVLTVDAQLLDLSIENNEAIASVQYQATIREDLGAPEIANEVWHVRKLLSDPHSSWLLAGIQQVA
jgi:predicted lipid-binding transport protein (Tim44 family)